MIAILMTLAALGLVLDGEGAADGTYREYGHHDVAACLQTKPGPDGAPTHSIDLACVERVLADLWAHARNYPPDFADEEEKARATADARTLAALIDATIAAEDAASEHLLRAGRFYAMAHNLDLPGASPKAAEAFDRLLKAQPEHAQGHFHYGVFLAGTAAWTERAVPHLEKALELGVVDADYPLGQVCIVLGREDEGLRYLRSYLARHPDDATTRAVIEAVEAGDVERK